MRMGRDSRAFFDFVFVEEVSFGISFFLGG